MSALALAACGGPDRASEPAGAPLFAALASPSAPGSELLRAGDLAGARAAYETALAADPDALSALNDLAVAYHLEGRQDAARRLLDAVVAAGSPRDQQAALVNLGELFALEGYDAAAQAYLETAREIDASRPEPWYALAVLADVRGDGAAVRASLREALKLDPAGAARAALVHVSPDGRLHLDALVADAQGDRPLAQAALRALAQGRTPALAAAAQRRLSE